MRGSGRVEAHVHITLEFARNPRRIISRTAGGRFHETIFDEETETALLDRLRQITSAGKRLRDAQRIDEIKEPTPVWGRRPKRADVEQLGATLNRYLFAGTVGQEVCHRLQNARERGQRLLVHLAIEDQYLRLLPWETATLPGAESAIPACWCPNLLLVRRGASHKVRALPMAGTLQVLLIIDDPAFLEDDAWSLWGSLHESTNHVHVAEPLRERPWLDVASRLSDPNRNWHVVVYAGHVSNRGRLKFAGESASCAEFARHALENNGDLRCVVLLGCSTWDLVAKQFLEMGLPAVLGTNFYLPTGLPHAGLDPFLRELATSGAIDNAYEALRRGLAPEHQATPALYLISDDTRLFRVNRDVTQIGNYLRPMRHRLDRLKVWGQRHEGWRRQLYRQRRLFTPGTRRWATSDPNSATTQKEVLKRLLERSVGERISIIGGPGTGKTTLLDHLAWELAQGDCTIIHCAKSTCAR